MSTSRKRPLAPARALPDRREEIATTGAPQRVRAHEPRGVPHEDRPGGHRPARINPTARRRRELGK